MSNDTLLTTLLPLLLALVAGGLAIFWVVRPLLEAHAPPPPPEDDRLAGLQARKEATLAAIRDLTFDYNLGKLTQEDFARHDARLRRQAIILMQQIEQIAPAAPVLEMQEGGVLDDALEAEIAAHRTQTLDTVPHSGPL